MTSSRSSATRADSSAPARTISTLAERRGGAAKRLDVLRARNDSSRTADFFDEMLARDQELAATAEELHAQVDVLRRAATLLERERSKYVDLFEHAPEPYIVTSLAGHIEEANVAAATLFCTEPEFLRGRPLISFVARQDTRTFRTHLQRLCTSGAPAFRRDTPPLTVRMRPRGQPVFAVGIRATVVAGERGAPVALRWVLTPGGVTEDGASSLTIADLASSLVEDLQAPMESIAQSVRSLRDGDVTEDDERRQVLDWIAAHTRAQRRTLDDLVEFAAAHGDASPQDPSDLFDELRHAVSEMGRGDAGPEVVMIRDRRGEGTCPRVPTIHRALAILVEYAYAGTPQGAPPPYVRVAPHVQTVVIEIMAPEDSRPAPGWSLRLGTAVRRVERAGGRVSLDGPGASARVEVPRLDT